MIGLKYISFNKFGIMYVGGVSSGLGGRACPLDPYLIHTLICND